LHLDYDMYSNLRLGMLWTPHVHTCHCSVSSLRSTVYALPQRDNKLIFSYCFNVSGGLCVLMFRRRSCCLATNLHSSVVIYKVLYSRIRTSVVIINKRNNTVLCILNEHFNQFMEFVCYLFLRLLVQLKCKKYFKNSNTVLQIGLLSKWDQMSRYCR